MLIINHYGTKTLRAEYDDPPKKQLLVQRAARAIMHSCHDVNFQRRNLEGWGNYIVVTGVTDNFQIHQAGYFPAKCSG